MNTKKEVKDEERGLQQTVSGRVESVVSAAFCKECGGFVEYNKSCRLLSSPPKYRGDCKECGKIHYIHCHKVD